MKQQYLSLVMQIKGAVRRKAQEIPKFRDSGNGAIRILAYPCCKEADDWFGGLSRIGVSGYPDDIVDYEHTFAIAAGGSRVITGTWDGVEQKVDCYAYSALKIAHCSLSQDLGAGLLSGNDLQIPYLTEDNGYAPHFGAICVEVKQRQTVLDADEAPYQKEVDFCGIYICVSGADSKDDLKCSAAAIRIVKEFFKAEGSHFEVVVPILPAD